MAWLREAEQVHFTFLSLFSWGIGNSEFGQTRLQGEELNELE